MKIQVSKVFANFINKTAKELNFSVTAEVVTVSRDYYVINVCYDLFGALDYGDYDVTTGKVKAIMLTYPEEFYACPRFLTTKELNKEFERDGVKDLEGLKKMVRNICEI